MQVSHVAQSNHTYSEFFRYFWLQFGLIKIDKKSESGLFHLFCAYFVGYCVHMVQSSIDPETFTCNALGRVFQPNAKMFSSAGMSTTYCPNYMINWTEFCIKDGIIFLNKFIKAFYHFFFFFRLQYTYWLIIFDAIFHQHSHRHFWKVLQMINTCFAPQNTVNIVPYIRKFVSFFSITISSILIIYLSTQAHNRTIDVRAPVFLNFIILIRLCQLRVFYYVFCVEMVNCQLKMIKHKLKSLKNQMNFSSTKRDYHWIRGYFHCVYEMVTHLNEIFGWSHVAAVSFCFYLFLSDLNWFYFYTHYSDLSLLNLLCKLENRNTK